MKKALIGTLALGLVIGAGALGAKSFANEQEFVNTAQEQSQFRVLNQETNQFETLDDSEYRGSNNNYGSCCQYNNNGNIN